MAHPIGSRLTIPTVELKRNNLLAVIPKLSTTYSVKFDFKPNRFENYWNGLIQLTASQMYGSNGNVITGFYFYPSTSGYTPWLEICVGGQGSKCYDYGNHPYFIPGQWTTLELRQYRHGVSHKVDIIVNNDETVRTYDVDPREFSNVEVFGSDRFWNASLGKMRNLVIIPNLGKIII